MANKKGKKSTGAVGKKDISQAGANQPWISMRSGLIIVAITSIGMAVLTFIQVYPALGFWVGVQKGLLFGVMIWVIFWGYFFLRRFLSRKG